MNYSRYDRWKLGLDEPEDEEEEDDEWCNWCGEPIAECVCDGEREVPDDPDPVIDMRDYP